ncbi:unnamed protein product [Moneuplotes crassus]|uniref:Uncharacterized protein n=1 Tax=Euplotes crassus TaxID=5936 RepID=A0AAD1XM74_EUPCR|nr:unnamed protein product [Moneuplotes crassus]
MQNPDLQANDLNLYKYKNKLSDEQKQLLKLLHVLHLIAFAASIGTGIFTTWIIFHKRPQIGYFIFLFLNIIEKPVSFMYIFFPNQSISHFCKIGVFFCWGINWIYAIICFVVLFILAQCIR